tara:strand:+ start:626 stop:1261 length:636 start_codon:yes stop_codon:yes gene_type:complete
MSNGDKIMEPAPVDSSLSAGVNTNIARQPNTFLGGFFKSQLEEDRKLQRSKNYKGIVLYTKRIKLNHFLEKFSSDFAAYVLQCKTTSKADLPNIAFVCESIVYIPEISGCLPYPEMNVIEEKMQQLRDEMNGDDIDEDFKKLSTKKKKAEWGQFYKSLKRLDRFPRFYSTPGVGTTSADATTPVREQVVMCTFLDGNDWGSSGVLLGTGVR